MLAQENPLHRILTSLSILKASLLVVFFVKDVFVGHRVAETYR